MNTENRPTHLVYCIKNLNQDKNNWTKVGAMWSNKDGKGFNIVLDLLPLDGKLTARENDIKIN